MLPADTFACTISHGVAVCTARQPSAEAAYKLLALRVKAGLGQLEAVGVKIPVQEITIGLTIGPSMALAVQSILGLLSLVAPVPPSLQGLFDPGAPPTHLVTLVATNADEIVGYLDATLAAKPQAFQQAMSTAHANQVPQQPLGSATQALGALFTKDRIIAIGTGLAVVGGLIALAHSADRRLSGKVDRSRMFHDPNAVYGDDDDDGDDSDESDAEVEDTAPPAGVIDAASVEVPHESEPAA